MARLTKHLHFLLAVFILLNSSVPSASASAFSDVNGHKNQTAIEWLALHGVVVGYTDGSFRPGNEMTRAELLTILVKAQGIEADSEQYKNCFPDVTDDWYAPTVCYAKEQNWVEGYANGLFKPTQTVNKAEALKMLVNILAYTELEASEEGAQAFEDIEEGTWYYPSFALAYKNGLLEETGGNYGINEAITRGELSEALYRALVTEQYELDSFSDYQTLMSSGELVTCSDPVQVFGDISADEGEMTLVPIVVCEGYRYTACTQSPVGNPDLYGASSSVSTTNYEEKSDDGVDVSTDEEGNTSEYIRPDCITFEPESDEYELGVFGGAADTLTNLWVSSSKLENVPQGFERSLTWFADTCTELTNDTYGPFNTPWGNAADSERPFFDGYGNYIHGGSDFACEADTVVEAMCDGTIVDSNDAGGDWGWHTVLECTEEEQSISIAFIHLQEESVLPVGTVVKAGDPIGKVFPLESIGESVHVHITACKGTNSECFAGRFQAARGAARQSEWWGVSKLWFDIDWHTNPGLYKVLPGNN
jgi:murein DD-endopeptidase MepM/ murein hydrolase activator NlpD